jgi:hypothetical protein
MDDAAQGLGAVGIGMAEVVNRNGIVVHTVSNE